jgi:hypothetical protein
MGKPDNLMAAAGLYFDNKRKTMKQPDDDFWNEIGKEASNKLDAQLGDLPETAPQFGHTNYEILPIEELRKRAEKLHVPHWQDLNKQKLIDEIRNYTPGNAQ